MSTMAKIGRVISAILAIKERVLLRCGGGFAFGRDYAHQSEKPSIGISLKALILLGLAHLITLSRLLAFTTPKPLSDKGFTKKPIDEKSDLASCFAQSRHRPDPCKKAVDSLQKRLASERWVADKAYARILVFCFGCLCFCFADLVC